jgi:hypothetical protein
MEMFGNETMNYGVFLYSLRSGYMLKLVFSGEGCVDGFKVTSRYTGKNMGSGRHG